MVVRPYQDQSLSKKHFIRSFSIDTPSEELVWHRDHNSRQVTILEGNDWAIQFDNQVPQSLKVGEKVSIPSNTYHRIIKGTSNLKLDIVEQ